MSYLYQNLSSVTIALSPPFSINTPPSSPNWHAQISIPGTRLPFILSKVPVELQRICGKELAVLRTGSLSKLQSATIMTP
jgi:hypothetical protein